ncbi:MAG: hypothetical protein Kow00107_08680 [Planctomycetota bacterium]
MPVIDCCTREVLGWEIERTARSKTAERALENALLNRLGYLACQGNLTIRHDNGLVFWSKICRSTAANCGLKQEFITPFTTGSPRPVRGKKQAFEMFKREGKAQSCCEKIPSGVFHQTQVKGGVQALFA